jgi:RHS repeat-associated protein
MIKTWIVLFGILFAGALSAKTLPKMNFPMNGNAFVMSGGSSGVTHQAQLPSTLLSELTDLAQNQNASQHPYSLTNTLELVQLESTALPVDFDYTLTVTGKLTYKVIGSTTPVTSTITLTINSSHSQKTSRRLDYFTYSNAYDSQFDIEPVTLTTTQSGLTQEDLYVAVSKVVELNFGIQGSIFSAPIYNTIPALHGPCVDNVTNELVVSWDPVNFAVEYELEFTYRDNYTDNILGALPASSISYDFKENSTRIITRQNFYRIPLVYERGYLLYRVRAVAMGGPDLDKRIPCRWSGLATSGSVEDFPDRYGPFTAHISDKMNWQLSTTYGDEGKRKDVMQYYDGLFMNRQTVTGVSQRRNVFTQNVLDNAVQQLPSYQQFDLSEITPYSGISGEASDTSTSVSNTTAQMPPLPVTAAIRREALDTGTIVSNTTIQMHSVSMANAGSVAAISNGAHSTPIPMDCKFYGSDKIKEIIAQEVIYDFNGRPSLQILPVPTGTHKITYIKKLNRNQAGQSYSWKDFDMIDQCQLKAHSLSNSVTGSLGLGAAAYYGTTNPNTIGYNAFIPDSKGVPFSRVQYTPDNTGRTYRQGGVGEIFQLEQGHETKFYYAKPNQVELDRMFGNEVGYAIRYQKNMVVDPNGQVSVSYLNPEGKTIATALTGNKPANLLELDNENYPPEEISVDLLASNTADSIEHSLTINEQFVVPQDNTNYTFTYTVKGATLTYKSCAENNVCLDCIYDLNIFLIDNQGCTTIPLFSYSGTFGDLVRETGQVHTDLSCIGVQSSDAPYVAKPDNFPASFPITLSAGSYTLVKTLKVNKYAVDAYVNLVFKDTCKSVLQGFIDMEKAKIDTTGCYQSCSTCKDANVTTPANCDSLCSPPMNDCDRARHSMLRDVSPGGQYGQYDIKIVNGAYVYDAGAYPLSVFNPGSLLHCNCLVLGLKMPDNVTLITTLKELIDNWNATTFPPMFLMYHPEYCMLQWCDNENTGKDYDMKLVETAIYGAAVAPGSGILSATSTEPAYKQLLMNDPFFHNNNGTLTNPGNAFLLFLTNPCNSGESVLEMAIDAAYCQSQVAVQNVLTNIPSSTEITHDVTNPPEPYPPCAIPAGYHTSHTFGSDPNTKDLEWRNLRDLYRTYKEKYLYLSRRDYSITNHCFNGCIGAEHYWFDQSFPYIEPDPPNTHYDGHSYSVEGMIPVNTFDPCGAFELFYEKKVKHFTNRYDAFSHTTVDLHGIDLYSCLTLDQIADIKSQIGNVVSQYVCDTCFSWSASGKPDSCWVMDFAQMLNQYLPSVTGTNPITLSGSQIAPSLRNLMYATSSLYIVQIKLDYDNASNNYHIIFLVDNNHTFIIAFPARTVGNTLIFPSGACCAHILDDHNFGFTLQYADGSGTNTVVATKLPLCPEPATGKPYDSCDTCYNLNPLTIELFSFLKHLKQPGFPQQGEYVPQGQEHKFEHLLGNTAPLHYAMDQNSCSLTLSASISASEVVSHSSVNEMKRNRSKRETPVAQQITKTCNINFVDCNWLNSAAYLVSIKPYLPAGQMNVPTNEFILTYVRFNGVHLDTFTVHGTSNCFPINDCHKPYFCDKDSMPNLTPSTFNGCVQAQLLTATFTAYSHYGKWLDSMKNDLREKYYDTCMRVEENMHYEYRDSMFHYTLYYYDQAGNLVRTVPPAGVRLLPASDASIINGKRNNPVVVVNGVPVPVTPTLPNHTYITNYAYNSLNQIRWQITPDAGKSTFYYDRLGRIAASQNAKQLNGNNYSYTYYDNLGRTVESGELLNVSLHQSTVDNYANWKSFLHHPSRTRRDITYTKYDEPFTSAISDKFGPDKQQNLRSRVASVLSFADNTSQSGNKYRHATHYSYDVTGNVPILIQDYPLTPLGDKVIAYNFDLVSWKVNEVRYSPDQPDEFRHHYDYDDELRLTKVSTSRKGIVWETDAEYFYYKHGPLARTELGELKVQGLDYIYTLQGWIKGVNGTTQDRSRDAGRDGITLHEPKTVTAQINGQTVNTTVETDAMYNSIGSGYHSLHNPVAADAFGYVLGFYNDPINPDYTPIDPTVSTTTGMDAAAIGDVKPLYNGNIGRMYTWLQGQNMGGLGMNYRYDRLNRLKKQEAFTIGTSGAQTLLADSAYGMDLSYDGSGNIITLKRHGRPGNTAMDDLTYHYLDAVNGSITDMAIPPLNATNRLGYVEDAVTSTYPEASSTSTVTDIDNQSSGNYAYDAIGNLVRDNSEHISGIQWNLQNKITSITKTGGIHVDFAYDALGNRVYKKFLGLTSSSNPYPGETYYVRDAQGNIMATYEVKNKKLYLQEQEIYGSSRLGIRRQALPINVPGQGLTNTIDWQNIRAVTLTEDSTIRGSKQYELSNHLGNVLATISDRRMQTSSPPTDGSSGITADLISATDYYAFGMEMPGRKFSSDKYKFGFNGKLKDDEVYGEGNFQDYGFRMYDTRVARFISVDPLTKKYPWYTPYQFAGNMPISAVDLDGMEPGGPTHLGPWLPIHTPEQYQQVGAFGIMEFGVLVSVLTSTEGEVLPMLVSMGKMGLTVGTINGSISIIEREPAKEVAKAFMIGFTSGAMYGISPSTSLSSLLSTGYLSGVVGKATAQIIEGDVDFNKILYAGIEGAATNAMLGKTFERAGKYISGWVAKELNNIDSPEYVNMLKKEIKINHQSYSGKRIRQEVEASQANARQLIHEQEKQIGKIMEKVKETAKEILKKKIETKKASK